MVAAPRRTYQTRIALWRAPLAADHMGLGICDALAAARRAGTTFLCHSKVSNHAASHTHTHTETDTCPPGVEGRHNVPDMQGRCRTPRHDASPPCCRRELAAHTAHTALVKGKTRAPTTSPSLHRRPRASGGKPNHTRAARITARTGRAARGAQTQASAGRHARSHHTAHASSHSPCARRMSASTQTVRPVASPPLRANTLKGSCCAVLPQLRHGNQASRAQPTLAALACGAPTPWHTGHGTPACVTVTNTPIMPCIHRLA